MEMENQSKEEPTSLGKLVRYFLYLGTVGFGGPAALVGFMHRELIALSAAVAIHEALSCRFFAVQPAR
jgi:chromate transport protein ChrA